MNTTELGYKEYKCNKCGWVHAAITREALLQQREGLAEMYMRCFNCSASSAGFVPAEPADAPDGCTLQPVYVPGAWEEFLT